MSDPLAEAAQRMADRQRRKLTAWAEQDRQIRAALNINDHDRALLLSMSVWQAFDRPGPPERDP